MLSHCRQWYLLVPETKTETIFIRFFFGDVFRFHKQTIHQRGVKKNQYLIRKYEIYEKFQFIIIKIRRLKKTFFFFFRNMKHKILLPSIWRVCACAVSCLCFHCSLINLLRRQKDSFFFFLHIAVAVVMLT